MITFTNKGEIDVRAITTFGISSKENDNAIGYFGTGLKYAIAVMLREGVNFSIVTGGKQYEFETRAETVRVDEFNFCFMRAGGTGKFEQLPFTTELGKNWELWQAFRELYCNCTDENGEISDRGLIGWPDAETTVVFVDDPKFDEVYEKRGDIILQSDIVVAKVPGVEIYNAKTKFLYFKGVRVYELPKISSYTYNITSSELILTEDRTVKCFYTARSIISKGIAQSTNKSFIRSVLKITKPDFLEAEFDYDWSVTPTPEFCDIVLKYNDTRVDFNFSAFKLVQKYRTLNTDPEIIPADEFQNKVIEKAVAFCRLANFPIDDYPIHVSPFLGRRVMGLAHNDAIYLAEDAFKNGTKYIASTLIEEYLHLKHGFEDESRALQTYLFDTIADLIERHILKDVL